MPCPKEEGKTFTLMIIYHIMRVVARSRGCVAPRSEPRRVEPSSSSPCGCCREFFFLWLALNFATAAVITSALDVLLSFPCLFQSPRRLSHSLTSAPLPPPQQKGKKKKKSLKTRENAIDRKASVALLSLESISIHWGNKRRPSG